MQKSNRAIYKINKFMSVECNIIKKSRYLNDFLVSYIDPFLGGESQEWVEAYKVKV